MVRGLLCVFLVLSIAPAPAAEPKQVQLEGARFVGSVGCKSSSCHGGAGEKRSQYITWQRQDFHTRAYAVLTNARSARMAETLGLAAAQESARCTVCHSPFQAIAPARLAATVDPRESVSCESCHGAAESWLRGHTRPDWTYATRIGAGMRDLKSFYVRANMCVACHQNIDADLRAAGHPELVFELDGQSVAEPKHWRDEPGSGPRAWLTGQAVALRETSWRLAQSSADDPQLLAQWDALAWLLSYIVASDRTLPPIDSPDARAFAEVQQQADALARRASTQALGSAWSRRLLGQLAALDPAFSAPGEISRDLLFRRARRLVLALDRLANGDAPASATAAPNPDLALLRDDLRAGSDFDPTQFASHLRQFRENLPAVSR